MWKFTIDDFMDVLVKELPASLEVPAAIGEVRYSHNGDMLTVNLDTGEFDWEPLYSGKISTSRLSLKIHMWFGKGWITPILNTPQRDQMTVTRLGELSRHERYSWIIPEEYEDWAMAHRSELARESHTTGILVERQGNATMYHCTDSDKIQDIMIHGLRVSDDNDVNLSFGGNVIYAYPSVDAFELIPTELKARKEYLQSAGLSILEIVYSGKYLYALAEWDKPEQAQHTCLLYPEGIKEIHTADLSALETNLFE